MKRVFSKKRRKNNATDLRFQRNIAWNRSFQLKRVKFQALAPAFPIFVLAGSSIPAMRQIEWPMKQKEKQKKKKKGKPEEGKILNNWCGGLLWVDWLDLRQLRKYFFFLLVAPKMVPLSNTSVVNFPPPQCWFFLHKKQTHSYHKKYHLQGKKDISFANL